MGETAEGEGKEGGKEGRGGKRKALQKVNVYKYPPIGRMEILSHDGSYPKISIYKG